MNFNFTISMKKYFKLHVVATVSLSAPIYAQSDQVEKLDETIIQGGYGDGISNVELSKKRVSDLTGGSSCLLYTSPSPRDQRGSRMPSSA